MNRLKAVKLLLKFWCCISEDSEDEYSGVVKGFVRWSEENHLQLNIGKTKELVVDFGQSRKPPTPITIQGVIIETVNGYKFLGVRIDNKLDWSDNTEALYRKSQSRLFFLGRFRFVDVCGC